MGRDSRKRPFLYYYPSVMILGVAIALAVGTIPRTIFGVRVSVIVLLAAAVVFLWCYPRMDCALGCRS